MALPRNPVWCCLLATAAMAGFAWAQVPTPDIVSVTSRSRQFLVVGRPVPGSLLPAVGSPPSTNLLRLEPSVLAIFGERIKYELLRVLGAVDQWQGLIHLTIRPARDPGEDIAVASLFSARGWTYHVNLPSHVEADRLVRCLVPLLLLEMAHRTPGPESPEIPRWLVEGMNARILGAEGLALATPEGRPAPGEAFASTRTVRDIRRLDPLGRIRAALRTRPALGYRELVWPSAEELEGARGASYRLCAELFVHELLLLPEGPACLRQTLAALVADPDPEIALLKGFQPRFKNTAEVEKWWTVTVVDFVGRDASHTWPFRESLVKLDEVLRVPVQVRASTNDLPLHGQASLQAVIQQWNPRDQVRVLQLKLHQLQLLQNRISPQLLTMLVDYRKALAAYLAVVTEFARTPRPSSRLNTRMYTTQQETLRLLNLVDAVRDDMRLYARDSVGAAPPAGTRPGG